METIVGYTLPKLTSTPDSLPAIVARIKNYIRVNADKHEKKNKATGQIEVYGEPPRTRAFSISRGPLGGVRRWSDYPA